jgi:hypothetical protein
MRSQIEGHEHNIAERAALDADRIRTRRARRVARGHAAIWIASAIVYCQGWHHGVHHAWLAPLVVAALGLSVGLYFRKAWAFYAALGIDLMTVLIPVAWAIVVSEREAWMLTGFVSAIPLLLGGMLLSIKGAYDSANALANILPVQKPSQPWSDPGRQF